MNASRRRLGLKLSGILTALIIGFTFFLTAYSDMNDNRLSAIGQAVGGFAAVVAFIWMIVSFINQERALSAHQDALALQFDGLKAQQAAMAADIEVSNTELFIDLYDRLMPTLDRYCSSVVTLYHTVHNQTGTESTGPNALISLVEGHPTAFEENPVLRSLMREYVSQFNFVKKCADRYQCTELFERLSNNSAHSQLFQLLCDSRLGI